MNAKTTRILKEARALFWPWCAVMIAGALPLVQPFHSINDISPMGFFLGIPLLATLSLGNEFQHRTLSLLLTQPVDRMEIWGEKLSVTVVAVLSAALVFFFCWRVAGNQPDPGELVLAGAWIIATIASATFWTLFARSTLGGIALNGMVPSICMFVVWGDWLHRIGGTEYLSPATINVVSISAFVFLCYAGVMLWLGRRTLARFQVTAGMAGDDLLMAGPSVMPGALAGWFRYRPTGAVLNLIRKELRLLRPLWLFTLLAVLFWIWVTIQLITGRESATILPGLTARVLLDVSTALGAARGKIITADILIAILAGILSLGEERTLGTHSWHLTLPVSARRQWLIKLVMAMCAGFVCAVLLPTLVVTAVGFVFGSPSMFVDLRSEMVWLPAVLLLSFASFWCACAVSGTVRAVLWAVPAMGALGIAGQLGGWVASGLTDLIVARFGVFTDFRFTNAVSDLQFIDAGAVEHPGQIDSHLVASNILFSDAGATFKLVPMLFLVPILVFAVIHSYRLFRAQVPDSTLSVIRNLLPLAVMAFLCVFSLVASYTFVGHAKQEMSTLFRETHEAIEKIQPGTPTPLQLTGEDLAKAYPLSERTRRWLRNSRITVAPDKAHPGRYFAPGNSRGIALPPYKGYPWYLATINLAGGPKCTLSFHSVNGPYGFLRGVCE